MLFHHIQESLHQLRIWDGDDLVHMVPDVGEHLVSRGLDGGAVSDGVGGGQGDHMARLQAGLHAGRPLRLHADDFYVGVEQLGQGGHTRRQPAAADGHQDDVHVGQVLEDLIGDGALAGGHLQVVEGVDIGQPLLLRQLGGQLGGLVKDLTVEDDLGPVVLGIVHLHQGGGGGHDDGGGHAGGLGSVGHALGVVAGGGGDQAPLPLFLGQGADLIVSAPDLVGAGDLHIFGLEIDPVAAALGQGRGVDETGLPDHAL